MREITIFLLAIACLLALNNWRVGFSLIVLTGLLQDPLRKLVPDQPVYFVMFAAVIFVSAYLGALKSGARLSPSAIPGWNISLAKPFNVFLVLVTLQAAHSLVRFSSPLMTAIGLVVWLAPVAAIMLSYQFCIRRGMAGVRSWMSFYCTTSILFLGSVYIQSAGADWRVLGEVGEGIIIYDLGTILEANSGLFRSSEIAAWHASAVSCFLFVLTLGGKVKLRQFILTVALVAILVGIGLLTGRRKMLLEIVIFFIAFLGLTAAFQSNRRGQAFGFLLIGALAFSTVMSVMGPDSPREEAVQRQLNTYQEYSLRGQSVFSDAPERLINLGFSPVSWAIESVGWLGSGLGTGSQGTAGIADGQRNIWAAEGGLGKIVVELGVPGLLLAVWFLLAGWSHLKKLLRVTNQLSPIHARFAYGLLAFLIAKGASFSVAAQAYSDPFILIIMGISVGFLLAMPTLARYK